MLVISLVNVLERLHVISQIVEVLLSLDVSRSSETFVVFYLISRVIKVSIFPFTVVGN